MIEIDKTLVGEFGSPVGLNGEIKVIMMTSSFEVFKNLKHYINFDETIKWKFSKMINPYPFYPFKQVGVIF